MDEEPTYDRCDRGHIDPDSVTGIIDGKRRCLVIDGNPRSLSGFCHATVREVPIDQAWYDAQDDDDEPVRSFEPDPDEMPPMGPQGINAGPAW